MKKLLLFSFAILTFAACTDVEQNQDINLEDGLSKLVTPKNEDPALAVKDMEIWMQKNQARLANATHLKKDCDSNIRVPQEYATIQEAVDNVCDGGVIIVSPGTYEEVVFVDKPGVHLKANGEVLVIGGFNLSSNADNTTIQQFMIEINESYRSGISGIESDGLKILENKITFVSGWTNSVGVRLFDVNNSTVHKNEVYGTGWGIFLGTTEAENASSMENVISNNYLTGVTFASVIGLQGNSDKNFIHNNIMENNPSVSNASIMLFGGIPLGSTSDENIIKNNSSDGGYLGLWLLNGGTLNQIGPNNQLLNHQIYGIYIFGGSPTENTFFKNTALGNLACDIVDLSDIADINYFIDNTADCTTGI
jgi:hypothetical protein